MDSSTDSGFSTVFVFAATSVPAEVLNQLRTATPWLSAWQSFALPFAVCYERLSAWIVQRLLTLN